MKVIRDVYKVYVCRLEKFKLGSGGRRSGQSGKTVSPSPGAVVDTYTRDSGGGSLNKDSVLVDVIPRF
jgi:hypothetical protein